MTEVLALDLGTTRIKGGRLGPDGRLSTIESLAAPPLSGAGVIRESDAEAYAGAAATVLDALSKNGELELPLGLASQRSSFLLWERESGRPVTALISWQDRRAAAWCEAHQGLAERTRNRTGLPLSPHYAGPKLAALLGESAELRRRSAAGALLFGNLDAYLVWKWTRGEVHESDLTMAARTLLADPVKGAWCEESLEAFGVPACILPSIVRSAGRTVRLRRGELLRASIADQAAGALALLGAAGDAALVNLGTGGFVLLPTGSRLLDRPGFLAGPVLARADGVTLFALEGTINGAGPGIDRHGAGPTALSEEDRHPHGFCLPDSSGVGAPHWRPRLGQVFSPAAGDLPPAEKRRLALEGLIFRVREILAGLRPDEPPARILLAGGLARDEFVPAGLAACLGREVELLEQTESTLLGAARLAAGWDASAEPRTARIAPGRQGAYLRQKAPAWDAWLRELLDEQA